MAYLKCTTWPGSILTVYLYIIIHIMAFSPDQDMSSGDVMKDERYRMGKERYEAMKRESRMPKYSGCWTDALRNLDAGCKALNDDIQHRLSLHFTNCFLLKTGRETYPCESAADIAECTENMTPEAYNTYTEFFTHTQNICFFLQAQVWQASTEDTIYRLADNSALVAQQIEDSSELQGKIIQRQNESIQNQELLLKKGNELKTALDESAVDINMMVKEFKEATAEQRESILDVFDRIQALQSLVMGEFTGFYSFVFYTVSLIISYLLTSTPRTGGARFLLFLLMSINVAAERLIVAMGAENEITEMGKVVNESEVVYLRLRWCRTVFSFAGILIWLWKSLHYRDLNKVNNELLEKIVNDNSQIKHLLQTASSSPRPEPSQALVSKPSPLLAKHLSSFTTIASSGYGTMGDDTCDSACVEGYVSGSESDSSCDSSRTDHTFQVSDNSRDSDTESFVTSSTTRWSREGTPALLEELRELRQSTPLREITPIPRPDDSMSEKSFVSPADSRSSTPVKRGPGRPKGRRSLKTQEDPIPQPSRYNLRSRSRAQQPNPVINTESSGDFGRMVKHLAKVAMRNTAKAKYTVERISATKNEGSSNFFSSDDD